MTKKKIKSLDLPAELATRRCAVFGISGSGKSNTATVLIEHLLEAREQVVLVDPKGEGWGLQTSANGKAAAFDVVVFGEPRDRSDVPELREEHAEQIADFIVDSGRSVVLSLLGFDSDQAERRFVTNFFKRLYRRKSRQTSKTRTLVVLEEAHLFVPEQASGASGEMVGAIKRIARQGRSAGLGLMIVDQRPQDVAKSIISQSELLICHQLTHKLDRDALREWVRAYDHEGQGEAFLNSLAELEPGEAWLWSPAWLKRFERQRMPRRSTYDSGATPDGSQAHAPKVKTKIDLDKLRTQLATIVEDAKANDPKLLKTRISELERQLKAKPAAAAVAPKADEAAITRAVNAALAGERKTAAANLASVVQKLTAAGKVFKQLQTLVAGCDIEVPTPAEVTEKPKVIDRYIKPTAIPAVRKVLQVSAEGLPKAEAAILAALYWLRGEDVTPAKVAFYADYSVKSSSFANACGKLRTLGLASKWSITEAGEAKASEYAGDKPTGEDLRQWLRGKLPKAEKALLDAVIDAYPNRINSGDLGEAAGYSSNSSSFGNALGKLRTIEAIEGYEKDGGMIANSILFD